MLDVVVVERRATALRSSGRGQSADEAHRIRCALEQPLRMLPDLPMEPLQLGEHCQHPRRALLERPIEHRFHHRQPVSAAPQRLGLAQAIDEPASGFDLEIPACPAAQLGENRLRVVRLAGAPEPRLGLQGFAGDRGPSQGLAEALDRLRRAIRRVEERDRAIVVPEAFVDDARDPIARQGQPRLFGDGAAKSVHRPLQLRPQRGIEGQVELVAEQLIRLGDREQLAAHDGAALIPQVEDPLVGVERVEHRRRGVAAVLERQAGVEGDAHAQYFERVILRSERQRPPAVDELHPPRPEPRLDVEARLVPGDPGLIHRERPGDRRSGARSGVAQELPQELAVAVRREVEAHGVAPGRRHRGEADSEPGVKRLPQRSVQPNFQRAPLRRLEALPQVAARPVAVGEVFAREELIHTRQPLALGRARRREPRQVLRRRRGGDPLSAVLVIQSRLRGCGRRPSEGCGRIRRRASRPRRLRIAETRRCPRAGLVRARAPFRSGIKTPTAEGGSGASGGQSVAVMKGARAAGIPSRSRDARQRSPL